MNKKALITGISGQDGSYLAELLLSKGYEVHGTIRTKQSSTINIDHIIDKLTLHNVDMVDSFSLEKAIIKSNPDEIYNLAAQTQGGVSYQNSIYTCNVVGFSVLKLLEIIKKYCPQAKVFQAGSSEMFGTSIDIDGFQREETPFRPPNPYACSKQFSHNISCNYRHSYGLFISNGILFNHESPRRGENFVTSKIIKGAIDIYNKKNTNLKLGTLSSQRDWGHAKDYANGMWTILQQETADDFVLASGITHSIEELCQYVFSKLNLDYKEYVVTDPEFVRPIENIISRGDSSKLRTLTGWQPEYTFESMIDEMIEYYLNKK
jgi:GDPmannose 4,6-dehydratase